MIDKHRKARYNKLSGINKLINQLKYIAQLRKRGFKYEWIGIIRRPVGR